MGAAEMLKTQYSNVFAAPQVEGLQLPIRLRNPKYLSLTNATFTAENGKAKQMALRKNATPGMDSIHQKSLILLANHIPEPLVTLFQRMVDEATPGIVETRHEFAEFSYRSSTITASEISCFTGLEHSSNNGPYQFVFLISYPDLSMPTAVFHKGPYLVPVYFSHS
ncbi:unnamed protein product [Echinostoma caproni]|uniref:BURP domain-containing protein n=1 Tax=Echinostoma caproni TaxID=27848 RepID=A0A183AL50_9TREM|nr:unnamed protein product [Echinostoma caproni]